MVVSAWRMTNPEGTKMRDLLLAGKGGLCLAFSAAGAYADSTKPHYATALPNFFSSRSPLLATHYGYDDRDTTQTPTESEAASVTLSNDHRGS
jgi:hypothetical protein